MRAFFTLLACVLSAAANPVEAIARRQTPTTISGTDVSQALGTINWSDYSYPSTGFAYVQATIGASTVDSQFDNNFYAPVDNDNVAFNGAYHTAFPNESSGSAQANFFWKNGGYWTNEGPTIPGAVALLPNQNGDTCYDLSTSDIVLWITDFINTYQSLTLFPTYPMIYTSTAWWAECAGNTDAIASYSPLWIQSFSTDSYGELPAGWTQPLFWQFAGPEAAGQGNQDVLIGSYGDLESFGYAGFLGYSSNGSAGTNPERGS